MQVNIHLLLLSLLAGCAFAQSYFRNIDYLGCGYDVISGDPQSTGRLDPGIKESVIKITYNNNTVTGDHRFFVPDGTTALNRLSCSYNSEVTQVTTSQELSKSKQLDVKVGVNWEKVSFSASLDTKKTVTTITNKQSKYTFAKGLCIIYRATIGIWSGFPFEVSDNFKGMVINGLADNLDDDDLYFQFLDLFGTHVIVSMDAGAKTVIQSEFTKEAWSKTTETSRAIGADASFAGFTGSFKTEEQRKNAASFDQERTSYENHVIGALPTDTSGDFSQWAAKTSDDPVPVKYTLMQISDLLTKQYFPQVPQIYAIKTKLDGILKRYCSEHKTGCTPLW